MSTNLWLSRIWNGLVIPYLLLNLIRIVVNVCTGGWHGWLNLGESVVLILLGWHSYGTIDGCRELWFVYSLLLVRLINYGLSRLKYKKIAQAGMLVLCFILGGVWGKLDHGILDGGACQTILLAYSFFMLGFVFRNKLTIEPRELKPIYVLAGVAVESIVFYIFSRGNGIPLIFIGRYGYNYFNFCISAIVGIGILMFVCMLMDYIHIKAITIVSKGTIVVLALHYYAINWIQTLSMEIFGIKQLDTLLFAIGILLAFIPLLYLIEKYCPILVGKKKV